MCHVNRPVSTQCWAYRNVINASSTIPRWFAASMANRGSARAVTIGEIEAVPSRLTPGRAGCHRLLTDQCVDIRTSICHLDSSTPAYREARHRNRRRNDRAADPFARGGRGTQVPDSVNLPCLPRVGGEWRRHKVIVPMSARRSIIGRFVWSSVRTKPGTPRLGGAEAGQRVITGHGGSVRQSCVAVSVQCSILVDS